jgi:hypothetical protein
LTQTPTSSLSGETQTNDSEKLDTHSIHPRSLVLALVVLEALVVSSQSPALLCTRETGALCGLVGGWTLVSQVVRRAWRIWRLNHQREGGLVIKGPLPATRSHFSLNESPWSCPYLTLAANQTAFCAHVPAREGCARISVQCHPIECGSEVGSVTQEALALPSEARALVAGPLV